MNASYQTHPSLDFSFERMIGVWSRVTSHEKKPPQRLEDIPNIGKSIAADLRALRIETPQQLLSYDSLALYWQLAVAMGARHDPCVLYTLMAAKHFLQSGEKLPWWRFTAEGKRLLMG